jgi:hypothetical protein
VSEESDLLAQAASITLPLVPRCYCGVPTIEARRGSYTCPRWRWWRLWERHRHGRLVIPPGGVVELVGVVSLPVDLPPEIAELLRQEHGQERRN